MCLHPCSASARSDESGTDLSFVLSTTFVYKVAVIVAVSSFPLYLIKAISQRYKPATYTKVAGH